MSMTKTTRRRRQPKKRPQVNAVRRQIAALLPWAAILFLERLW
jgi:hypothetical protein